MTVTLYTIATCPFSLKEKDYLTAHTIPFTEIVLDQTPDKLTEFRAIVPGYSAVPLTVITKDDGSQVTIKGFSTEELDLALHVTIADASQTPSTTGENPEKPQPQETPIVNQVPPVQTDWPVSPPYQSGPVAPATDGMATNLQAASA